MKKKIFGLVMALLFGLQFAGYGQNVSVEGTWVNTDNNTVLTMKNGVGTTKLEYIDVYRYTYSVKGDNVTMTLTNINGMLLIDLFAIFGVDSTKLYSRTELGNLMRGSAVAAMSNMKNSDIEQALDMLFTTQTVQVKNNKFTVEEFTGMAAYTFKSR